MICTLPNASIYFDANVVDNSTPVLLLHSALGTSEEMRAMRALFRDRSTIVLDLPGHGRTTETSDALTTAIVADIIDAFLERLNIPQVDIVGYSLGGYVALAMASQHSGRVRSVVTHAMKFFWSPEAIDAAIATFSKAPVDARTINAMASIIRDFNRVQLTPDDIRAADIPVLLTTGERDEFVTAKEVSRLWQEIASPNASLAIFPGAGHSLKKLPMGEFEVVVREFWGIH